MGDHKESACYFCNEMFEMGKLQNHLKQCGSILEQCPLRCGAWIQRKHRDNHVADCPQMEKSRSSSSPTHARASEPAPPHTWTPRDAPPFSDALTFLEKEVAAIKLVVSEEAGAREVQATELETVRARLVLLEERSAHFLQAVTALRAAADGEAARAADLAAQFKHDLANVQLAVQEVQSQQLSMALRLEGAECGLAREERERELLEQALTHQDGRIRSMLQLEEVIEYIKQTVEEESKRNAESRATLEAELAEARRSSAQLADLAALRHQIQTAAERPGVDRVSVLEVSVAQARAEAEEQAARAELLGRDLRALAKSYHKLRQELADFQHAATLDNPLYGGDDGHLIWRIDNFSARMKDAKENDTVLSSPLFRTCKYGYTLKAEVHLNGIGKWKGRHVTATARCVSGPYDALLAWPADLTLSIVLRDQPATRQQAMDIVKTLEIRRKAPSRRRESDADEGQAGADAGALQLKRQYVFIPHTSLDKFDYVKGDVMFLEFTVVN
ncbi:TNF receptor-associated factor 5 [Aricia agestis]|uniref:TNF receptor-associated factor 5 n=1 Tax=Aricia agestis TaxID=91739 RepID=UPI001C20BD5F|nr:TNF receptor-associated factor 5 [Aricia agestis]